MGGYVEKVEGFLLALPLAACFHYVSDSGKGKSILFEKFSSFSSLHCPKSLWSPVVNPLRFLFSTLGWGLVGHVGRKKQLNLT